MKKSIVLMLLISSSSFASVSCPSVQAIKAEGLGLVKKYSAKQYQIQHTSNYQTPHRWKFDVLFNANSQAEAVKVAKEKFSALRLVRGPMPSEIGSWCQYSFGYLISTAR